jgi:2,4-dienoyl-CoA reductase-like NADH-dependent reductase (Old Yellow Enzyme family)
MCQISHMGRRTASDDGDWIVPIAPSSMRDPAHHAVPRAMEIEDIDRIVASYAAAAAPAEFLVSLRMAIDESQEGGPNAVECLTVAASLYGEGLYDLLNLNGIAASTTWGISKVVGGMAVPLGTYLSDIAKFRTEVGAPTIHAGRIADIVTAAHAISSGAIDLVGMTRAPHGFPAPNSQHRPGTPPLARSMAVSRC